MAEELESIRSLREARAAAAAARRAQAAAGPPSREAAEAAQRAAGSPTAAQARAAQRAAGNYVNSRDLLMDQGQSRWNDAVNDRATRIPPRPATQAPASPTRSAMGVASAEAESLGSRASRALREAGSAAASAARNAGPAIRAGVKSIPYVGTVASLANNPVADATLTGPEGRRRLAEEQAAQLARQPQPPGNAPRVNAPENVPLPQNPRSAPPRVTAPEDVPAPGQPRNMPGRPPGPSGVITSGDREPDAMNARPSASNLRQLQEVVVNANRDRQTRRPNTRMSPREMSANELNEISQAVSSRRGGVEMEPGRAGDIARRIAAREGEQERQAELSAMKRGGPVKKMAKGGVVKSSASSRSDGCVSKGKTRGRMV